MIREARPEDLEGLLSMARRFCLESRLPLTFDDELARQTIWNHIHSPDWIALVEEADGILTGSVGGAVARDYFLEPCVYLLTFYVEKELRGLGTSRDLLLAFNNEAANRGVRLIFTSATSGMGERVEKLYTKLFERYGYQVLGPVLVKEV